MHFEDLLLFLHFEVLKGREANWGQQKRETIYTKIIWIVLTNIEMDHRRMGLKGKIKADTGSQVFALQSAKTKH